MPKRENFGLMVVDAHIGVRVKFLLVSGHEMYTKFLLVITPKMRPVL